MLPSPWLDAQVPPCLSWAYAQPDPSSNPHQRGRVPSASFAGPGGQFSVEDYARMLANLMKREPIFFFAGPGGQFSVEDYARMLANLMKREKQRQAEGHKPCWNGGGSCLVLSLGYRCEQST